MKDIVYISDQLEIKYPAFKKNLTKILTDNGNRLKIITGTKDIWCRDYMPLIGSHGQLVRFIYHPSYLDKNKKDRASITNVDNILTTTYEVSGKSMSRWQYIKTNIKLDGGAIEVLGNQGIISSRIFKENNTNSLELLVDIKRLLGLQKITVVPEYPDDFTGHVDGLVRFIDHNTVLINNLSNEEPEEWIINFKSSLHNAGYKMEELPYRAYENEDKDDAKGIYMIFLNLNDLIIMPSFTFNQEDKKAKQTLEKLYPGKKVVPIYATDLAKEGGIVNCVTWNKQL